MSELATKAGVTHLNSGCLPRTMPAHEFGRFRAVSSPRPCPSPDPRPFGRALRCPSARAAIPIWFHSDGQIDDAVEMLLAMGVDCISPMDTSGIDYHDYKKRYGHRVTLHGNIDITWPLVKGTPDDVRRDVKEHMDSLKPVGRYIAGSSHSIVNYIPHENFLSMINAVHEYGKY